MIITLAMHCGFTVHFSTSFSTTSFRVAPKGTAHETSGEQLEGLGNFGKPTGQFGTVEQANEDDAVVKWDDEGRVRVHQLWLKKI